MNKDVNCLNTKALLEYLTHEKNIDLNKLLKNIDPTINELENPVTFLSDPNNWISCKIAKKLYKRARKLSKDDEIMFKVGYWSLMRKTFGYVQNIFLKMFGPILALKQAQKINDKFNMTKNLEIILIGKNKAYVRLKWFKHLDLSKDFCMINKGIYSAIPELFKLKNPKVEETKCFFEGDDYCEYYIEWKNQNIFQRIIPMLFLKRRLLKDAIIEIEEDKLLLKKKYEEINRLNISLQNKIRQLKAIQNSTQLFISIIDKNELLKMTMKIMNKILKFDRAAIFLIDKSRKVIKFTSCAGVKEKTANLINNYEIPISKISNILARVVNTCVPEIVDNVENSSINLENSIIKIFKPSSFVIVPLVAPKSVIGVLVADRLNSEEKITEDDKEYLQTFASQIAIGLENSSLYNDLQDSYLCAVKSLVCALEAKDPYTKGHSERVTYYSRRIAEKLNLNKDEIHILVHLSMLHDIGKIGISENILKKSENLTAYELNKLKNHPEIGEKILKPISMFGPYLSYIRNHHEKYNGTGYPDKLKGKEIPIGARIICVADSFDAMISDRAYRPGLSVEAAIKELKTCAGSHFDPVLVKILIEILSEEKVLN